MSTDYLSNPDFAEFLSFYNSKILSLSKILDFMDKIELSTFQDFIQYNKLSFHSLSNYNLKNYEAHHLAHLKFLENYGLTYQNFAIHEILNCLSLNLFRYLLEDHKLDFDFSKNEKLWIIIKDLDLELFLKLVNFYNIDIYQIYNLTDQPLNNSNDISNKVNLFYFLNDTRLIKYLLEQGLDPHFNLLGNRATAIFLSQAEKYIDLYRLSDENIYYLLKIFNDFNFKISPKFLKDYVDRVLNIDCLNVEYHYKFLLLYLENEKFQILKDILKKYDLTYSQDVSEEKIKKGFITEDKIFADFWDIMINDFNVRNINYNSLDHYLKKFKDLYQRNFSEVDVPTDNLNNYRNCYNMLYILRKLDNIYFEDYFELAIKQIEEVYFEDNKELVDDFVENKMRKILIDFIEQKLSYYEFKEECLNIKRSF